MIYGIKEIHVFVFTGGLKICNSIKISRSIFSPSHFSYYVCMRKCKVLPEVLLLPGYVHKTGGRTRKCQIITKYGESCGYYYNQRIGAVKYRQTDVRLVKCDSTKPKHLQLAI
jgi:hypothetical protein